MPPRHRAQGAANQNPAASPAAAPPSAAAAGSSVPSAASHTTGKASSTTATGAIGSSNSGAKGGASRDVKNSNDAAAILAGVWRNYVARTEQRVKVVDAFMAFLVVVGVLQFVYCVLGGNYPFNAFLSGFSATVGQFVLTASLRIQTNPENKAEFESISHERAFADYVFGSLLLHFFCVNFIN